MWVAFANESFQQNISIYAIFINISFNDIVSFEHLGPDFFFFFFFRISMDI